MFWVPIVLDIRAIILIDDQDLIIVDRRHKQQAFDSHLGHACVKESPSTFTVGPPPAA